MPGHHHHMHGAKNPMKARYDSARRMLDEAGRAQTSNQLDRASQLLDKVIDDTGMKLTLASSEARAGKLAAAVALKKRVAEARLEMYRRAHLGN
jgi:hypothetical protein